MLNLQTHMIICEHSWDVPNKDKGFQYIVTHFVWGGRQTSKISPQPHFGVQHYSLDLISDSDSWVNKNVP